VIFISQTLRGNRAKQTDRQIDTIVVINFGGTRPTWSPARKHTHTYTHTHSCWPAWK